MSRPPAGLILAGGAGSRLGGVIKARLRVGGIQLIDRAVAALGLASPILFAHGALDPAATARPGLVPVADGAAPPEGPLAGLVAALAWLDGNRQETETILSLAVDTPFFPADFAERALPLLSSGAPAVLGCFAGQDFPTNALWRVEALREAQAMPKSLARLADRLGAARLDWAGFGPENPFANVNTLPDLLAANRRAMAVEPDARQGNFGLGKAGQSR